MIQCLEAVTSARDGICKLFWVEGVGGEGGGNHTCVKKISFVCVSDCVCVCVHAHIHMCVCIFVQ